MLNNLVFESFTAYLRDYANEVCQEYTENNCKFWNEKLTKEYLTCKEPKWNELRVYWMQRLTVEYGCMVWCTTYDLLRSKIGDNKAFNKANDADFTFRKKFT